MGAAARERFERWRKPSNARAAKRRVKETPRRGAGREAAAKIAEVDYDGLFARVPMATTVEYARSDSDAEPSGPQPIDWALLFLRAVLRRKLLFGAVFVAVFASAFVYYRLKPPVYRVEARMFVQRQVVVPSTVRPHQDESPTRTAWELVHRRENLIALIQAAKLLGPGPAQAANPARPLSRLLSGAAETEEDPLEKMIRIVDRRLEVIADEANLRISFEWRDAQQAYRVVDAALTNFIEARHVQEVTAIDEVISVLRARAATAKEELDAVTDRVRREVVSGPRDPDPAAVAPAGYVPSEELTRLRSLLESKTRAIADVEEFRRRRLAELQAQLAERRNMYSEAHPLVIQLGQDIEAISRPSEQVDVLRQEEAALRKEFEARAAREVPPSAAGVTGPRGGSQRRPSVAVEDDERVRGARYQYQSMMERVNAAQLELDAVRAAFKYRYNVIWPPQVPVDPVSPNPVKILGAGFLAALFFAMLAAAAPDLRTGRIVERWQVERSLDLPILGDLSRK